MTGLLKMSVYAVPLIVATIILRALLINRLPKKAFMVLWAVALCRLLIPITLPSPVSVYSLASWPPALDATDSSVAPVQEGARDASPPQTPQAVTYPASTPLRTVAPLPPEEVSAAKAISLDTLLPVLWAAGFAGCAGFFILTHLRCRRVYRAALPLQDATVSAWLRDCHFRRAVRVLQSDQILAPLTYGIWRPVILLPKSLQHDDPDRLSYVLAHECTHIRRFDVLGKWLLAVSVCVHWFNPLVWAMYALASRDVELCCDEAVVRSFGETAKSAYAMALINLEETRSRFAPLCNNFSKTAIEERIISIMKYKKTSVTAAALAVVLILGTTAGLAFGAAEQQPQGAALANQGTSYIAAAENVNWAAVYEKYEAYGITYDAASDTLYHHGQLIRCFDDEYPLGDYAIVGINHFTEDGVVDVHTVRDLTQPVRNADGSYDPGGILVGVAPYSQAEFDARKLDARDSAGAGPTYTAVAEGSEAISPEEMAREYSVYEPYGITYDMENNLLYYRGKLIYYFLDVLSSNGEGFSSGKFQGAMRSVTQDGGELSVQVIRDYGNPDANGYGRIVGVETSIEEPAGFFMETRDLRQSVALYAPYGLTLDESTNTMWYQERQVRQLYDSFTGALVTTSLGIQYPADAIDVEAVYTGNLLTGLRQATQAEYDLHTQARQQRQQAAPLIGSGGADETLSSVEWWTAEEYEAWLEQEKINLQSIIGGKAWNERDGWFIWTQEKIDEAIRTYEQILENITKGGKVSKPIGDSGAVLMQNIGQAGSVAQDTATIILDANAAVSTATEHVMAEVTAVSTGFSAVILLRDGTEVELGTFGTYVERYKAVEAYCERQIAAGAMTQDEANAILRQYM